MQLHDCSKGSVIFDDEGKIRALTLLTGKFTKNPPKNKVVF